MGASEDRIAEKVASKLAVNLAAAVAATINAKLNDLHERQAVQGTKIDYLCLTITEDREERKTEREKDRTEPKAACDKHQKWTASIGKIVEDHEALKNRAIGAAKVITKVGAVTGSIIGGALLAKWKHWLGL